MQINVFLMAFFSWSSDGSFISTGEKAVLIVLLVFLVPMAIIRGLAVSCVLSSNMYILQYNNFHYRPIAADIVLCHQVM